MPPPRARRARAGWSGPRARARSLFQRPPAARSSRPRPMHRARDAPRQRAHQGSKLVFRTASLVQAEHALGWRPPARQRARPSTRRALNGSPESLSQQVAGRIAAPPPALARQAQPHGFRSARVALRMASTPAAVMVRWPRRARAAGRCEELVELRGDLASQLRRTRAEELRSRRCWVVREAGRGPASSELRRRSCRARQRGCDGVHGQRRKGARQVRPPRERRAFTISSASSGCRRDGATDARVDARRHAEVVGGDDQAAQ